MNPRVSFVLPCYKLGHLLSECVTSTLSQTYDDLEVLIMDDYSPDQTPVRLYQRFELQAREELEQLAQLEQNRFTGESFFRVSEISSVVHPSHTEAARPVSSARRHAADLDKSGRI